MRVPTVQGPSVEERPLNTPMQRSSVSPGALQDNRLETMGRAMNQIGAEIQEREDADLVMRAETEVKSKYLEFEASAKQRVGTQAMGVTEDTKNWWDKEASAAAGKLANPRQKRAFEASVERLRGSSIGHMSGFEQVQRRDSVTQSAQASIVGSIQMAAANPGDSQMLATSKEQVIERSDFLAHTLGWTPEVAAIKKGESLSQFHGQVIEALADQNPNAAKDYFAKNKDEIPGTDRDKYEKLFKTSSMVQKAQTFADKVMLTGTDEATALAQAREQFEGDEERLAVAEVKTRFAERTGARERMQRDAADEAWAIYGRTGSISTVPPSVLSRLDGRDIAAIRNDQEARNERNLRKSEHEADRAERASRRGPTTNWDRYYELKGMATSDDPMVREQFQQLDLRREFPQMDEPERRSLISLQTKKPKELANAATLNQQIVATRKAIGMTSKQQIGLFDRAVTGAVEQEQERLGRKLSVKENQEVIDRLAMQGEVLSGSWFKNDPNKRFYEVLGTPEAERFAPDIATEARDQIVKALEAEGIAAPTDAQIRARYKLRYGIR